MIFDLLRRGLYFDKDESGGGGTDDSSGEDAEKSVEDQNAGGDKDKGKAREEEKLFTQAQLDALIDDRLKRERKKAETETEKARKKAEEEALTKNQEWQKLAEQRQAEIDNLTKQKAEIEPFKDQSEKYKKALDSILAEQKKSLPKFVLPLIEKMDPVEAMEYITANAKDLGAKPLTYGGTPEGKQRSITDDEKQQAQHTARALITKSF